MSERQAGWYWVSAGDFWEAAELFPSGKWVVTGSESFRYEQDFQEIGSRIPTPDEPWATVPVQPDEAMINAAFWAWGSTDVRSIYIDMISSAPNPEDA